MQTSMTFVRHNASRLFLSITAGILGLVVAAPAMAQGFAYQYFLGSERLHGATVDSFDVAAPGPPGDFRDDVEFRSFTYTGGRTTAGDRYRAYRQGLNVINRYDEGAGTGVDTFDSFITVEVGVPFNGAPGSPVLTVETPFSQTVEYSWHYEDENGNGLRDYAESVTVLQFLATEFLIDLEEYGTILVEMEAAEFSCPSSCAGGGSNVYFTWNPVPEPGTGLLVGVGLGLLSGWQRRHRAAQ